MKIDIIGAGAIGALVAGYLSKEGSDVTLIGRRKDVSVIQENGLLIEGIRGNMVVPVKVTDKLEKDADLTIWAVKTQDIASSLSKNASALKNTSVLTVQNGVRAEELLLESIPKEKIISSVVTFGATYLEPGKVVHNFEGDWVMGKAFIKNDEEVETIASLFGNTFSVCVTEDIREMKWLKLFINLNNCFPALTGKSMQETFSHSGICELSIRLLREALTVIDKAEIKLKSLPNFPVDRLRAMASMPLEEAGQIFSQTMTDLSKEPLYGSILQSIKRGRPSEIDYINGEIVRLGDKMETPAHLNKKVVEMVHRVESRSEFFTPEEIVNEVGR